MTDGMLWPAFTVVKAGSEMRRYYDERLLRLAVELLRTGRSEARFGSDKYAEWDDECSRLLAALPEDMR